MNITKFENTIENLKRGGAALEENEDNKVENGVSTINKKKRGVVIP